MIHIKKFTDINMVLPPMRFGIGGEFDFKVYRPDGRCRQHLVVPNIITDIGMDAIGGRFGLGVDYLKYIHLGEDNTAEAAADTSLYDFVDSTLVSGSGEYSFLGVTNAAPYYGYRNVGCRRLPEGILGEDRNFAEVGIGPSATNVNLCSRALIKDGGGTPTTLSVLKDEYLDVNYRIRVYPDHIVEETGAADDGTGSIDISGTSYGYTIRPAGLANYIFWAVGGYMLASNGYSYKGYGPDATIGAVTGTPSATLSTNDGPLTASLGLYNNGNFDCDLTWSFGLNDMNLAGGIGGLYVHSSLGSYQVIFGTPVPKTNTKVWNFQQNYAWARKTL